MTLPIHTVKHVRATYRRHQVIAIVFTLITLAAALATAVSGVQMATLRKKQAAVRLPSDSPLTPAQQQILDEKMTRKIEELKTALDAEKKKSDALEADISKLREKMAATKAVTPAKAVIAVPKPAIPASQETAPASVKITAPAKPVPQVEETPAVQAPSVQKPAADAETFKTPQPPQPADKPAAQPAPQEPVTPSPQSIAPAPGPAAPEATPVSASPAPAALAPPPASGQSETPTEPQSSAPANPLGQPDQSNPAELTEEALEPVKETRPPAENQ